MASLMKIGLVTVIERKVKFTVEIPRRPREGELSYSSTFSFASALRWWVVKSTSRPLYPWERAGIHLV